MSKVTTITLKGASGRNYEFDVYAWGTLFKPAGAVYTVLKEKPPNFTILYIGQTGDPSTRFDYHHKQVCFNRNGKTHVGIHLKSTESGRMAIEADLLANHSPVCNY